MKKKAGYVLFLALAVAAYSYAQSSLRANAGSFSLVSNPNTTVTNCPAIAAGASSLCVVATGVYASNNGGAYFLLGGGGAVVNDLKIGTKTCNLGVATCAFNIAATSSQPTTTAPSVTVSVN